MKNVKLSRRVSSEMLVKEYLKKGGKVEVVKDYNPGSKNRVMRRAKNKNWVSDKEMSSGYRHTSSINRDAEMKLNGLR